jgi:eukaryotic-like serine/threonine-protein kinase
MLRTKLPKLPRIVYLIGLGIGLYFFIPQIIKGCKPAPTTTVSKTTATPTPTLAATSICEAASKSISCGGKILFPPRGNRERINKKDGFAAIKKKDFSKAKELLQKDFDQNHDPETLYALNNATIFLEHPQNVKTIAVPLPIHGAREYVSETLMKGVSQAQFEWNQSNHGYKLLIAIADDNNEPADAKQIAEELTKHPDILAVLGHYSSNVTVSVKNIYDRAHTVLLSSTSTTDELTSNKDDANNYFFRVTNTTTTSAENLYQKWLTKPDKIVLFYTPGKAFSEAFRKAFVAKIPPGTIVKGFLLSDRSKPATQELAIAKAAGAKTIVVVPDAYTDENEIDRVFSVIRDNQGQMPILANSIVQDTYLFKVDPAYLKNLVISVPIHPLDRQFIDTAKLDLSPNWWGTKNQIKQRIIYGYDGMQVLLAALDRSIDRETVRKMIAAPGFSVQGITRKISFNGSDRAEKIDSLVTPNNCDTIDCNFELAR